MTDRRIRRWRVCLTALATLAEFAQLAWQHLHGGVVSHHLLDRADLPTVSNGWGALLIPGLVWFLTGRIQRRLARGPSAQATPPGATVAAGFVGALLFGIGIAVSFTYGEGAVAAGLFEALVVLAVVLPGFRAECVLGFVLGMAFTFGAVLPTAFAWLIAGVSALVHFCVWPLLARLWQKPERGALP